jgi:mannonate dehydratase
MCLIHSIGGAFKRQPEELDRPLVKQGHLTSSEGECLREIYDYNPLLFDFVLKRTLKRPGTSKTLPTSVFMINPRLSV